MGKDKFKIYQKWWFWLIIAMSIILTTILIITIFKNNDKGVGTSGISIEEFEKIDLGMTQFEVNSIIDQNDEWNNEEIYAKSVQEIEKSKEDSKYTYVYKYYGEKGGYAIITLQADYSNGYFYNDVVVIKKQSFNLK